MAEKIGIILGSGLNKLTEELSTPKILFTDKNSFHNINIISGELSRKEVILFSGRRHFYEGYSNEKIFENVLFARDMGIDLLIITNAAGGINKKFNVPDLMLISSHLNFLNKIINVNKNITLFDKKLICKIIKIAKEEKIILRTGSYCCNYGPMYETRSEIRYLRKLGVDAVGMSTIPEILYANNLKIRTLAISCITNLLSENSNTVTAHDEVIEAGKNSYSNFSNLIKKIISNSSDL